MEQEMSKIHCFYTSKNQQIAEFWPLFGFELLSSAKGNKTYCLSVEKRIKQNISFIKID